MKKILTIAISLLAMTVATAAVPNYGNKLKQGHISRPDASVIKESKVNPSTEIIDLNVAPQLPSIIDRTIKMKVGDGSMLTKLPSTRLAPRRAAWQEELIYINFYATPVYKQVAGPIAYPSHAIPYQYIYSDDCKNIQMVYGTNLYTDYLYSDDNSFVCQPLLLGYKSNDQALICTGLDGTQKITMFVEAWNFYNTDGLLRAALYDNSTGDQISSVDITINADTDDIFSATFPAGGAKNVRLELNSIDLDIDILQYQIDAAPADFNIAPPTNVSHTIADNNRSFTISADRPTNANYNQYYIYKRKYFNQTTSEYSVWKQDFEDYTFGGTSYTAPDKSRLYVEQRFDAIPGGFVYGMANYNKMLGIQIDPLWAKFAGCFNGFTTQIFDLTPTNGALELNFMIRPMSDVIYTKITRVLWNKQKKVWEPENHISIGYIGDANKAPATFYYDKPGQGFPVQASFPAINTSIYDPSMVYFAFVCENLVNNSAVYCYFDDFDFKMTNIPAGTEATNLWIAEPTTAGSFTVSANLDEADTEYFYTVYGLNRDPYYNDVDGDWYLVDDYLIPVKEDKIEEPKFYKVTLDNNDNETSRVEISSPAVLDYGDIVLAESAEGTTVAATYAPTNGTATPMQYIYRGNNSFFSKPDNKKHAELWHQGSITASAYRGSATNSSEEVTLNYTLRMPATHVLAYDDVKGHYDVINNGADVPWFSKLQLQTWMDGDVTSQEYEDTPRVRYTVTLYNESSALPTDSYDVDVSPVVTDSNGAEIVDITLPDTFIWGRVELTLFPVDRYGNDAAEATTFIVNYLEPEILQRNELTYYPYADDPNDPHVYHVYYEYDVNEYPLTDYVNIYAHVMPKGYESRYVTNNVDLKAATAAPARAGEGEGDKDVTDKSLYTYYDHEHTVPGKALAMPLTYGVTNLVEVFIEDPTGHYLPSTVIKGKYEPLGSGFTTALDLIDINTPLLPVYYTLQGVRVDKPVPGNIYIMHQGNTVKKVAIR